MKRKKSSGNVFKSGGNIPVVASIIVLIAFIAGLLLGTLVVAKSYIGLTGAKTFSGTMMTGSYADGWNAAKAKLKNSNFGMMFGQVKNLSGQVSSVSGNKIVFSAPLSNPLWDDSLKTRTAIISKDTVITVSTPLSPEQMQANQQAGQKQMTDLRAQMDALNSKLADCSPTETASSTCGQNRQKINDLQTAMFAAQKLMMPISTQATGTLADILTGENISVISDQDISEVPQFAVKQIIVNKISAPASTIPAVK
jgi:hypothetical protein